MAQGEVYRQRHESWNALLTLSQANVLGASEIAQLEGMQVAGEEGVRVTDHLSMLTDFTTGGLYDDSTVYMLDQQIFGLSSKSPSCLRRARSRNRCGRRRYRYHFDNNFPMLSGFFQVRNATGDESLPQEALIINRNTFDYNFNSALNPVSPSGRLLDRAECRHCSSPCAAIRRRRNTRTRICSASSCTSTAVRSAIGFRSTASFYHEAGPFTATGYPLSSNDVGTTLQFTVGRPWGKTAFITGYTRRDLTYTPLPRQYLHHLGVCRLATKISRQETHRRDHGRIHPRLPHAGHAVCDGTCAASGGKYSIQLESRVEPERSGCA